MSDAFTATEFRTSETTVFARSLGAGMSVLLLHGFPETHLMWRDVAPLLAKRCFVVCADLRGYGRSGCPPSDSTHAAYSKRAMAQDMVQMMEQFGFTRFAVAGHDRGGRVAYRMALDHPDRISRLAVLDVLPTETVWEHADARFALGFWPWSLLAQPEPLPEKVLTTLSDTVVDNALSTWDSLPTKVPADVRSEYVSMLRDPAHAHAICEEYRAAATIDREHDRLDRTTNRTIVCPVLALWRSQGALQNWYDAESGPLALWRAWAPNVTGTALDAGHFFPEQIPEQTADALSEFLLGEE